MIAGLENALSEVTLVLFTTLAPSGAVADALVAFVLLFTKADLAVKGRIERFFCLPLVIAMVGLVASATHLGNPSNALYAFTGVGRSPLSTEVFCAVMFLLFAGVYWLYSFATKPKAALQRILLVFVIISAAVFVLAVAFAYSVDTILTWSSPLIPISLVLNALTGGPVLALFTLMLAMGDGLNLRFRKAMCALGAAALLAGVLVYALFGLYLKDAHNYLLGAYDLVPHYWPMLIAHFFLCAAGIFLCASCVCRKEAVSPHRRRVLLCGVPVIAVFAGIFIMRFAFYMSHMTAGLGL